MKTDFSKGIVYIKEGGYQGCKLEKGITAFYGIPYALPPIGEYRFSAPRRVKEHIGLLQAVKPGPVNYQWVSENAEDWQKPNGPMSEDCLYLNIFTPAKTGEENLPVLFWIHGGASIAGWGSDPVLNGTKLADQGIVVVTFNYRLGALGFLCHPELSKADSRGTSGNYGVMDMLMALEWVQNHIDAFGGNASRIIMGGQSAGAGATAYLMTSPLCRNKIKGAVLLSTTPYTYPDIPYPVEYYEKLGQEYMDSLGLHTLKELKETPVSHWVYRKSYMNVGWFSFARDNYIFNAGLKESFQNGCYEKVPMILGMTRDEFTGGFKPDDKMSQEEYCRKVEQKFGPYAQRILEAYPARDERETVMQYKLLVGGEYTMAESIHTAKDLKKYQSNIYLYRFDRKVPRENCDFYGAIHGDDLPYLFGTQDVVPYNWKEVDKEISKGMIQYLAQFVKTGNPNVMGLPEWPTYMEKEKVMLFGAQECEECIKADEIPNKERIELLESIRNF